MEDLPELPFEKVLSYLNLEDVIRSRAVSRGWYQRINHFRVSSLFYSDRPIGFIYEKNRLVSGSFVNNSISSSSKFESFVNISRQPILSNLKRLRLCGLQINNKISAFAQTLESFGQLVEELGIFNFDDPLASTPWLDSNPREKMHLHLPMLRSIHLEDVHSIKRLILKAPRLERIQIRDCRHLALYVVHDESVEMLNIDHLDCVPLKKLKKLKNLRYLYIKHTSKELDSTLLSDLPQLKEIHLLNHKQALDLAEQKQRYGRIDLKVFYCGCQLAGPDSKAIPRLLTKYSDDYNYSVNPGFFDFLAKNLLRLADEIPFFGEFSYSEIQHLEPNLAINFLNKFTDLKKIRVAPVHDVECFLVVLKKLSRIVDLVSDKQPQDLFDRLPEHCAVQQLTINSELSDFRFLTRLKHLLTLQLSSPIDAQSIRPALQVLEEPKFLSTFRFIYKDYYNFYVKIEFAPGKPFQISVQDTKADVLNIDDAVRFIIDESATKANELDAMGLIGVKKRPV